MTRGRFARPGREAHAPDLVEQAVARAKEGDTHAVHFLYVRFVDEVGAFVDGIVGDAHEAEDVTDTVFAKLVREVQRYEPGEVPFAAWILGFAGEVARSEMSTGHRLAAGRVGRAGAEYDTNPGRSPHLREALRRLPDDQRRVLVLRHIAGLSPKEVADRLGSSEASVRALDEHGRRALQAAHLSAA